MAESTIPAAKLALVNKITEALATAYADLPVNYGEKHAAKGPRIDVLDTRRGGGNTRAWKTLKAGTPVSGVDEIYNLPVIIYRPSAGEDETMQDVVEWCFAVFALIEAAMRVPGNVTLGVAGVYETLISAGDHEEIVDTAGFGCKLHAAVQIKARI